MKRILLSLSLSLLGIALMNPQSTEARPSGELRVKLARVHAKYNFGEHFGKPVFIRIFKEDYEFELWVQEEDGHWHIIETYDIAGMSGDIGPKTREGDCQAPEGFYRVKPKSMNPRSNYHLAFNVGYPNKYDRTLGRTGGLIMVHGSDVSIGCFAMTNEKVEEIYTLVNEAFKAGVKFIPVQVYPFRMTDRRMREERSNKHYAFWQHILPGYRYTEENNAPYPDKDSE